MQVSRLENLPDQDSFEVECCDGTIHPTVTGVKRIYSSGTKNKTRSSPWTRQKENIFKFSKGISVLRREQAL